MNPKLKAALQLVLQDLKALETPAVAAAVAGLIVPILATVAGLHVTPAEVAGWLAIVGTVAATLQKLSSGAASAKAGVDAEAKLQKP